MTGLTEAARECPRSEWQTVLAGSAARRPGGVIYETYLVE